MKHPITALLTTLGLSLSAVATTAHAQDDPIVVGGLNYTEHLILTSATFQLLEANGYNVDKRDGLGTSVLRQAQENGQVDLYWEYTGNSVILFNDQPQPADAAETYATAKRLDAEKGLIWLDPSDTNNTYALAVREEVYNEDSDQYDEDLAQMENLSDIGQLIEENPDKATVCVDSEFAVRNDGLPGMEEAYGYQFPDDNVSRFQEGVIYERADQGDPCNFGEVFTSDGRIEALDLRVLEDDQGFFPLYNPTINVREEVYQENKQLSDLFEPISKKITLETMQKLNARVDVDGEEPEAVAEDWLKQEGFIE